MWDNKKRKVSNEDSVGTSQLSCFSRFTSKELFEKHLFPTAAAGVIDRIIFHPWETIITLKQDTGQKSFTVACSLWRQKGLKGFYKGYFQNILAAIPIRVSIFGTYSFVTEQGRYTKYSPVTISLFAGFLTGFLESTILNPVDAYRIRKTLPETASKPFHMSLMFKGYSALLLRTSIENTICLLGTDLLLNIVSADKRYRPETRYVCAFFAGAASQYFSTPFDTVKTRRIKIPDKSYLHAFSSLYGEDGIKALFRSAGTKAMRAGVCNAMMIGTSAIIRQAMGYSCNESLHKEEKCSNTFLTKYNSLSQGKSCKSFSIHEDLQVEDCGKEDTSLNKPVGK